MAGLGNRRGSKTSSGSRSARDRVSAARKKMNGSSGGSSKGIFGGAKGRPKIGGGSKSGYILTESVDNLIGGKFTKKSGPRRATREELLEARKKREEEKSKTGKRMRPGGDREGVRPKRPVRVGIGGKGGAQAGGNQIDKVRGPKKGGVIGKSGRDLTKGRPGGNQIDKVRGPKSGVAPKRPTREGSPKTGDRKTDVVRERLFKKPGSKSGGVEAFKPSDKARGPVRGPARGNVGPDGKGVGPKRPGRGVVNTTPADGGRGPRPGGNQINNRGPKAGVGRPGGKRGGQGPKRSPGQTGGNVGPGGKGPNRFGDFEYGIIV